jgi:hypothetical protein
MIEITKEDAQNILVMSEKVQISGKEAMTVAQLQVKLSQGIQAEEEKAPAPKEDKKQSAKNA